MPKYIHISPVVGNAVKAAKAGEPPHPCVIVRHDPSGGSWDECHEAIIYGQDGKEAARIVFRPNSPLPPGISCWIETQGEVELVTWEQVD